MESHHPRFPNDFTDRPATIYGIYSQLVGAKRLELLHSYIPIRLFVKADQIYSLAPLDTHLYFAEAGGHDPHTFYSTTGFQDQAQSNTSFSLHYYKYFYHNVNVLFSKKTRPSEISFGRSL